MVRPEAPLILLMGIHGVGGAPSSPAPTIANLLLALGAPLRRGDGGRGFAGATRGQLLRQLHDLSPDPARCCGGWPASWWRTGPFSLHPARHASPGRPPWSGPLAATLRCWFFAALPLPGTGFLFGIVPLPGRHPTGAGSTLRAAVGQPSGPRAASPFLRHALLVTGPDRPRHGAPGGAGLFIQSLANVRRVELGLQVGTWWPSPSPCPERVRGPRTAALFR